MSATPIRARHERLHRSELAVPATSERFFAKARDGAADVIFLDLEDAVSDGAKDQARSQAIRALNEIDWGHKTLVVRVNGLDTRWALRDIVDVATHCPRLDMILLPKTGTAFDVRFVDHLLTLVEREHPRQQPLGLEVLIETAQGLVHADEIAAASPRLEAMIFGIGDYSVDMLTGDTVIGTPNPGYAVLTNADRAGPRVPHWNDQWHYALARIANACRANGLRAIDGPFTDFRDADGFRASARRSAALGFEGKWAIHPSQVELANEIYSPHAQQLEWANRISAAIEASNAAGTGAFQIDGVLIDQAHAKLARGILKRQALIERTVAPANA